MRCSSAAAPRPGSTRTSSGSSPSTCATTGRQTWNTLAQQCFNGAVDVPVASAGDRARRRDPVGTHGADDRTSPARSRSRARSPRDEVRSLARVLNRGAFPVTVVQQRVETVSPTAGESALRAAIIAGLIGVAIMLIVMVFYYRKLSVVIFGGLVVWGTDGLHRRVVRVEPVELRADARRCDRASSSRSASRSTPTSCIFERIRDETRHGRSLANAAPRSFEATWRTIVAADFVVAAGGGRPVLAERRLGQGLRPLPRPHHRVRPAGVLLLHPPGDVPAGPDAVVAQARSDQRRRRRRSERRHERQRRARDRTADTATVSRRPQAHRWGRLVESQTAIDFVGARKWSASLHLGDPDRAATVLSLWTQGLNLGIDFEGGVSWDVPAEKASRSTTPRTCSRTTGSAPRVPASRSASSEAGDFIKVQVGDQPAEVGTRCARLRRGGRRRRRRGQRQPRQLDVGERDHREGAPGAGDLPRAGGGVHRRSGSSGGWRSPRSWR